MSRQNSSTASPVLRLSSASAGFRTDNQELSEQPSASSNPRCRMSFGSEFNKLVSSKLYVVEELSEGALAVSVFGSSAVGLYGPRYCWEEEEREVEDLPWGWRECTRHRIQEAFEFCVTMHPSPRWGMCVQGQVLTVSDHVPLTHCQTPILDQPCHVLELGRRDR